MSRRLLIATDAWTPQVNGVVRTLRTTVGLLEQEGWNVEILHPGLFRSRPCPLYPEIPLSYPDMAMVRDRVNRFAPDHIHIATEGPVGLMARRHCTRTRLAFTTSFHTLFAEYLAVHAHVPARVTWGYLRWFHARSARVLAPSPSVIDILTARGFKNVVHWSRGIDTTRFYPRASHAKDATDPPRPVLLYAGRISKEKNIEAFLNAPTPGTKLVVGDGPHRASLEARHPDATFLGYVDDATLSALYADADVFVFPSRTDTFGNVILEALASGTPVAAFPVPGPKDILIDPRLGALDENLARAIERAGAGGDREYCARFAQGFTWASCTAAFATYLTPARR